MASDVLSNKYPWCVL